MESENINPIPTSGKKRILITTLFAIVLVFMGVAVYLYTNREVVQQIAEVAPVVKEMKDYTQVEKEQILAKLASSLPNDTVSQAEKVRILQNLSKKLPTGTLSDEEKLRRLRALQTSIDQLN